jgi:SAM-dependent methyltransferase
LRSVRETFETFASARVSPYGSARHGEAARHHAGCSGAATEPWRITPNDQRPDMVAARMTRSQLVSARLGAVLRTLTRGARSIPIVDQQRRANTAVDSYWSHHTVNSTPFDSAQASADYLEWRFSVYPLYREFMDLWGNHDDEVVLDYGCGPGNDVTGFLLYTNAQKVIGTDVSAKALGLARHRLELHRVDPTRVELIRLSDATTEIPLDDQSVDYFQSSGVLQHTSDPSGILRELHRVLKDGSDGRVMVYNADSVWLHLFVAYSKMVVDGEFEGLEIREAFSRTTDGPDCPIARCYTPTEWISICAEAGFDCEFVGGYPTTVDLDLSERYAAIASDALDEEHRAFLRDLEVDANGHPTWRGKHAGVGGVYHLRKRHRSQSPHRSKRVGRLAQEG